MKRKLISTIVGVFTLIALPAGSALAWHYGVTGAGQCQPDGSYKITWTVDNTSEPESLHILTSDNSAIAADSYVNAHSTKAFTQTASGTTAASFSVHLTGNYHSDQTVRSESATVSLTQSCTQPGRGGGDDEDKVTLCHATDSNTNPYVKITVDNDGAYNGHYTEHSGPVYPGSGGKWGDIIPPFTFENHTYSMNWDSIGQAIYMNNCTLPTGGSGGEVTPPTTTVTPTSTTTSVSTTATGGRGAGDVSTTSAAVQATAPVGGVGAGFGGGSQKVNSASMVGLLSSLSFAGLGLRKIRKSEV